MKAIKNILRTVLKVLSELGKAAGYAVRHGQRM